MSTFRVPVTMVGLPKNGEVSVPLYRIYSGTEAW